MEKCILQDPEEIRTDAPILVEWRHKFLSMGPNTKEASYFRCVRGQSRGWAAEISGQVTDDRAAEGSGQVISDQIAEDSGQVTSDRVINGRWNAAKSWVLQNSAEWL